jgi:hypothetical protein
MSAQQRPAGVTEPSAAGEQHGEDHDAGNLGAGEEYQHRDKTRRRHPRRQDGGRTAAKQGDEQDRRQIRPTSGGEPGCGVDVEGNQAADAESAEQEERRGGVPEQVSRRRGHGASQSGRRKARSVS